MTKKYNIQKLNLDELTALYGTRVSISQEEYFSFPFWFTKTENGWTLLVDLPDDLRMFLSKAKLGGDNPQPERKKL